MSAREEARAEAPEALREWLDVAERRGRAFLDGGVPEELAAEHLAKAEKMRRIGAALGVEEMDVAGFAEARLDAEDALRRSVGGPIGALPRLNEQAHPVEFVAEWRQYGEDDGATYFGTVRSRRTGEPVEVGPLTLRQLRSMPHLADVIYAKGGGSLPVRRRGRGYDEFYDALTAATRVEDHHVTTESVWLPRIRRYLDQRTVDLSDNDPESRWWGVLGGEYGGDAGAPFTDGERVYINAEHFADHLTTVRLDVTAQRVATVLGEEGLGFSPRTIQGRPPGSGRSGRNRKLQYWRSPPDFDWRAATG